MQLTTRSRCLTFPFALLLSGLLFTVGCSDSSTDPDDSTDNTDSTPQAITSDYYIQAKVDGKYKTVQQKVVSATEEWGMGYQAQEGNRTDDFLSVQETFFSRVSITGGVPVLDTNETFFLTFIGIFNERPSEDEDYALMIPTSSLEFGSRAAEKQGIEIRWRDENGKSWSTAYGSGDQTGSSFQIDTRIQIQYPQPWIGAYQVYNIAGTFNCTLYDGSGNSMPVTDGKFAVNAVLR